MDKQSEAMELFLGKPLNMDTLSRVIAHRAQLVRVCMFKNRISEDDAAAIVFCDGVLRQFKEKGFKV